jgi:hypothetical protein
MAQAAKKGSSGPEIQGQWEGALLDVGGQSARVVLELDRHDRRLTGDFSVYIESQRDGCCGGGWRLAQVAPVTGSFNEASGRIQLKYGLKLGRTAVDVSFGGRVVDADPHAVLALVGTYDVSDQGEQIGLEGGACLLWRYQQ